MSCSYVYEIRDTLSMYLKLIDLNFFFLINTVPTNLILAILWSHMLVWMFYDTTLQLSNLFNIKQHFLVSLKNQFTKLLNFTNFFTLRTVSYLYLSTCYSLFL